MQTQRWRLRLVTSMQKHLPLGEEGKNHRKHTPRVSCMPARRATPLQPRAGTERHSPPPSSPCHSLSCQSNWKATFQRHLHVKRPSCFFSKRALPEPRQGTERVLRAARFTRIEGRTHPCPSWWLRAQHSNQTDASSVPERKQNHPDLSEDIPCVLI